EVPDAFRSMPRGARPRTIRTPGLGPRPRDAADSVGAAPHVTCGQGVGTGPGPRGTVPRAPCVDDSHVPLLDQLHGCVVRQRSEEVTARLPVQNGRAFLFPGLE